MEKKKMFRYELSAVTTHVRGNHYANVYKLDYENAPIWFMSFSYGNDYMNAYRYVAKLNAGGAL